jgi:phosphatidylinositol alpha-mannosyltransferase
MVANPNPKLKIGFVLDGGLEKPDGVQQYILRLGDWLKSQGYVVKYIVAGKIAPGIDDVVSLARNIHVVSNGNRLSIPLPSKRKAIIDYLDKEKFDILHVQTPYSPLMGERLIMHSSKDVAIIGTFHIVPYNRLLVVGDWILGRWCHWSLKRFDKMLSVSSAAQRVAKRDFGINSEVLPNVVDYDLFNSAQPLTKYNDYKVTILFVGRLVPRKGCLYLLRAVARVVKEHPELPPFRVVICGTGPLEKALKQYCKANLIDKIVDFEGFIIEQDKPRYYASADISVFPSDGGESFGIVLLEAMASGRSAVLAGNNPGYSSVMSAMPDLLIDPANEISFANKLRELIESEPKRLSYAKWAKNYSEQYDVSVVGKKLLIIYDEALRKKTLQ